MKFRICAEAGISIVPGGDQRNQSLMWVMRESFKGLFFINKNPMDFDLLVSFILLTMLGRLLKTSRSFHYNIL